VASWSKDGFHFQHLYDLIAQSNIDLYLDEPRAAHRRLVEGSASLQTSLALRIQMIRVLLMDLRARTAIAAARASAGRAALLQIAAQEARALEARGWSGWTRWRRCCAPGSRP